jgi:hypothetical protein
MDFQDSNVWQEFRNDNAGTVPAFGIMRTTGIVVVEAGRVVLTTDQPNAYGDTGFCMINGPVDVDAGKYGTCARFGTLPCLYDSAQTPAFGEMWGPKNGSWKLTEGYGGWLARGAPTNTTKTLGLFAANPMRVIRGKLASDLNTLSSANLTIWAYIGGSDTNTTETISVYNGSSCTVKGSQYVWCTYDPSGYSPPWVCSIFQTV